MPSRYRDELISRCSGQLVVTVDLFEPCLSIYPLPEWELIEASLRESASLHESSRRLLRLLVANAEDVELDSNGRLLVPTHLRTSLQLDKQVKLVAQLNKFQLWSESTWKDVEAADFEAIKQPGAIPEHLLNLNL